MKTDILNPEISTIDKERTVLADAFCNPGELVNVVPIVHEDFFTSSERKALWRAFVQLFNEGATIDIDSLSRLTSIEAITNEITPAIGGQTASGVNSERNARNLRNAAARLRAYKTALNFMTAAIKDGITEPEIFALAENFNACLEGPSPILHEVSIAQVLRTVSDELEAEEAAIKEGKSTRIVTGFSYLDGLFYKGFAPGQLVILAARPSVGKTAIMLHMAKAAAAAGNNSVVFSLEMTAEELGQRLLYSTGYLRPLHVATGHIDWEAYGMAEGMLSPLPLYVNDFSRSLDDITARITQMVKQGKCDVAFIDYLGLIKDCTENGNAKLYQVIGRVTSSLKALAKRLRIPIVLLCQLNREAEKDETPQLYHLRDSGSIEQDADIVMMLQSKYEADAAYITIHVRKHRGGKRMSLKVRANDTYSNFEEVEHQIEGATAPESPLLTEAKPALNENEELPF